MPRRRPFVRLCAEALEDRTTPVSFSTTYGYTVGSNVLSVAIGDITGDGYPDIVAGTGDSTQVNVLINDGTGHFTAGTNVSIGAPFRVKLADLNGDGKLDILVGNAYGQQVVVALGNGDGTFQTPLAWNFSTEIQDVAAADFNGDGKLDVIAADVSGAAVLLNDGSAGVLGSPTFYHPAASTHSLRVTTGDFNGDGRQDFALAGYDTQRVDVYLNQGGGTFGPPTQYANPIPNGSGDIVAGDFDNDGKTDIAVAYTYSQYVGLLKGNGNGTFRNPVQIATGLERVDVLTAGDMDLDGNLDLLASYRAYGDVIVLPGNGAGGFGNPVVVLPTTLVQTIATGDVNGDGLPDIVTGLGTSLGSIPISINTTPVAPSFRVSAPSAATAGESFTITVTAKGSTGGTLTGYSGTVHFTSTDPAAVLPADYTFTTADGGTKTFTVTLQTAGTWTITAADTSADLTGRSGPITVSPLRPPVVADLGSRGLWHWTATGEWKRLSALDAEGAAVSADGETVVADFGAGGLRRWTPARGWVTLSGFDPEFVRLSADGTVVLADFGPSGLWRWKAGHGWFELATANVENATVSADGRVVAADFGAGGLRRWRAGVGWGVLSFRNPEHFAASADGGTVVADFGAGPSGGVRLWQAGHSTKLTGRDAEWVAISADGETVTADLGAGGLKQWTPAGGWVTLSDSDPEGVSVSADGETIVADFGNDGLQRWTAAGGWVTLSPGDFQAVVVSADGAWVIADFGPSGLWAYRDGWMRLSTLNAEHIWVG
jgi:FG-GAP-like repeat